MITVDTSTFITREDISRVYDEVDHRMSISVRDGDVETYEEYRTAWCYMLQGVYSVLITLFDNTWENIVDYCHDEKENRGYYDRDNLCSSHDITWIKEN